MALCPRITTYPPLGKVTVLKQHEGRIGITAVVEWYKDSTHPFHLELLHSTASDRSHPTSWKRTPFISTNISPCTIRQGNDTFYQKSCTVALKASELFPDHGNDRQRRILFAIQRRSNIYDTWKTVRGTNDVAVGEIIVPATEADTTLKQAITFEAGWSAQQMSKQQETKAWQIEFKDVLPRSTEDGDVLEPVKFGQILNLARCMAITRIEPYWFGCEHAQDYFHLSNDAVLLCFLTTSGHCISLLAFNQDDDVYTVFRSAPDGSIVVCGRNDSSKDTHVQVLASVSTDKQESIAAVMELARQLAEYSPKLDSLVKTGMAQAQSAKDDTSFFDNLGFCTWNALGQDLTADKIFQALETMKAKGILPNTLLIDDNWQTLRPITAGGEGHGAKGWVRFEANEAFPGGLKALVSEVKARYPQIQYVGVWHALFGYWAGIAPNSDFEQHYRVRSVRTKMGYMEPSNMLIIDPADIHRFFDDFYHFLGDCGVDFVKTDVQYMLSQLDDPEDRLETPSAYQSAWTAAHLKHFNGKAISCMSMVPQISLHSFLQFKTPKILLRNSDDFFPEIPESHPFHVFINAHNALIVQHLNCVPDWDMFQTNHDYSSYHAASRAISGGPVLITDEPGKHDTDLIAAMTALSPSGKRIAVRPGLATAVDSWNAYDEGHILKIGALTDTEACIMGVFNIAEGSRDMLIPIHEITDARHSAAKTGSWVLRSYQTGQIFVPSDTGVSSLVKIKLQSRGWDVLSAYPIYTTHQGQVSILGLVNKISGAAAITKCIVNNDKIDLQLKALGKLGVLLKGDFAISRVSIDNTVIDARYTSSDQVNDSGRLHVLDIEQYWKDENLWQAKSSLSISIDLTMEK